MLSQRVLYRLSRGTLYGSCLQSYHNPAYAEMINGQYESEASHNYTPSHEDYDARPHPGHGRARSQPQYNEFGELVQDDAFGSSRGRAYRGGYRGRGRGKKVGWGRGQIRQRTKNYLPHTDPKPGDWLCPQCNCANFRHREQCVNCWLPCEESFPRWSHKDGTPYVPVPDFQPRPGDWRCGSCSKWNFKDKIGCFHCNAYYTTTCESVPLPEPKAGEFYCSECNTLNFAMRLKCIRCDSDRPLSAGPARGQERGNWVCQHCSNKNICNHTACARCNHKITERAETKRGCSSVVESGDWLCPCGLCNIREHSACIRCKKEYIEEYRMVAPEEAFEAVPGDWICAKCHIANYRHDKSCFMCSVPRSWECKEIAYDANLPLSSTDGVPFDWRCGSCEIPVLAHCERCPRCPNSQKTKDNEILPTAWSDAQVGDWRCDQCGCVTNSYRIWCYRCGTPRNPQAETFSSTARRFHFVCRKCDGLNLSFRPYCYTCGAVRNIGEPPKSPKQWACNACHALNLSWLTSCFFCHAAKCDV